MSFIVVVSFFSHRYEEDERERRDICSDKTYDVDKSHDEGQSPGHVPIFSAGTNWDSATSRKYKLKKNLNCS